MVWIKRNLFFVISAAAGLLLTGYCAWLLYNSLNSNSGVSEEYKTTFSSFEAFQKKSPYPSKENIQAAKADQERVRLFLADFRKRFAPFPAPPVKDEKGFKTYLEENLVRFRAEATNAGVLLPPDYAFAFSGLIGKLTYPPASIGPWMQELEEIDTILNILYRAKINYLGGLQRVPVATDDTGMGDILAAATVTNQWGIVTPYKITFRGFSAEIAAVMEGFAQSSNCFIIQAIAVNPDTSVQSVVVQPAPQQPAGNYAPRPQNPNPPQNPNFGPIRPRGRPVGPPLMRPAPVPVAAAPAAAVPGGGASAPSVVTILSENPLLVTVSINVVKLKASEH
jgi:hypothetical protein